VLDVRTLEEGAQTAEAIGNTLVACSRYPLPVAPPS
jgi:hypothetical protein